MVFIGIALFMRRKKTGIIVQIFGVVYSYCERTLKCYLLNEFFVKFLLTIAEAAYT